MPSFNVTDPEAARLDFDIVLRPMVESDLDAVLAIERGFPAPWTRDMFLQELAQPDNSGQWVATWRERVVGYALWWCVADEIHIVNLAVHTNQRRRGIARRLLGTAFAAAEDRGLNLATLEVRIHNSAAIALYESIGFQRIAIRKAYYADNGEDALVMLKPLRPPRA
jgi:ribosomal-protein-alanine N-acetyltransferase